MRSRHNALIAFIALAILDASATSCASGKSKPVPVFQVGERVELSPFIYNIIDTTWLTHLGEGSTSRVPEHRFLVVRFSAMNTGAHDAQLPQFSVVDDSGKESPETADAAGVEGWLGLSRTVVPAGTLEGSVVFDVAPSTYKLRIEDPLDETRAVLVEMPLKFETPEPLLPQARPNEDPAKK
jgi:hypothetical protein